MLSIYPGRSYVLHNKISRFNISKLCDKISIWQYTTTCWMFCWTLFMSVLLPPSFLPVDNRSPHTWWCIFIAIQSNVKLALKKYTHMLTNSSRTQTISNHFPEKKSSHEHRPSSLSAFSHQFNFPILFRHVNVHICSWNLTRRLFGMPKIILLTLC